MMQGLAVTDALLGVPAHALGEREVQGVRSYGLWSASRTAGGNGCGAVPVPMCLVRAMCHVLFATSRCTPKGGAATTRSSFYAEVAFKSRPS
jgi:hypothetical protein